MKLSTTTKKFKDSIVGHPLLQETLSQLRDAIDDADQGDIILFYGPTGVGKTTTLQKLVSQITNELYAKVQIHPGDMPLIHVSAVSKNEQRPFTWKQVYNDALKKMLGDGNQNDFTNAAGKKFHFDRGLRTNPRTPEFALENALEEGFELRNVRVFIIDEAQDIADKDSVSIVTQLNHIKSKANNTKPIIILAGTYELIAFRNLSAQLSRRTWNIHFPRYRYDNQSDQAALAKILLTYQQLLPEGSLKLIDHFEFLYEGSLGCIGILHRWLERACKHANRAQKNRVTLKDLKGKILESDKREQIATELVEGERILKSSESSSKKLRFLLGMEETKAPSEMGVKKTSEKAPAPNPKRGVSNPGNRKPHRDKVGVDV